MNFSFIDEQVSGSSAPFSKKEVDWLRDKKGIQAILSVRERPLNASWVEGIDYLNVPVKNHAPPTLDELKSCVDYVMDQVSLEHKTNVHCAAGKGRTGTVLAAYFCRKYRYTPEEAIRKIRLMRQGSIERKQESIIRLYFDDLKKKNEDRRTL